MDQEWLVLNHKMKVIGIKISYNDQKQHVRDQVGLFGMSYPRQIKDWFVIGTKNIFLEAWNGLLHTKNAQNVE